MKLFLIIIGFLLTLGCTQKQQFPADVTGDLVPINKSQVIDYERIDYESEQKNKS